jgi:hypothetical protein
VLGKFRKEGWLWSLKKKFVQPLHRISYWRPHPSRHGQGPSGYLSLRRLWTNIERGLAATNASLFHCGLPDPSLNSLPSSNWISFLSKLILNSFQKVYIFLVT